MLDKSTDYWDNKYYYEAFNEEIKNFIARQKEEGLGHDEREKVMNRLDKLFPDLLNNWHRAWNVRINYTTDEITKRAVIKWLRKPTS